jgi:hypothetical protein
VPESVAVPVQADERLLRDIFGIFAVAEHAHEKAKDSPFVASNQAFERALVTRFPAGDEITIGIYFEIVPAL